MMSAGYLKEHQKWTFGAVPMPTCAPDEVLVQVKRAGICSSDVNRSMSSGFYFYPIIPGHEFCGVVTEVGAEVKDTEVGDRVAVYPLMACKTCPACKSGHPNRCTDYNFLGSRSHGGYAEYVACPGINLVKIPDEVSFEEAAMTEPYSVTLHATKRASNFNDVDTIAVMGLGPLGFMLAQWAKIAGVKNIIGFGRDELRQRIAKDVGFTQVFDTRIDEPVPTINKLTDGEGVPLIFECSGTNTLQSDSIDCAARGGEVILIGNPQHSLKIDKEGTNRILRREIKVVGSWSSKIYPENEWAESLSYMASKQLNPSQIVSHTVPLASAGTIIEDMYLKRFAFSKVLFDPSMPA